MAEEKNIDYHNEFLRKMVHLSSLAIPIGYYYLDKETALKILIPTMIIFVVADLLMKVLPPIKTFVVSVFGKMMRPHELKNELVLNGASWVLISSSLCMIFIPKISFICGFVVLIISDTSAALIGRKIGRHHWFRNKSIEGSTAFFLTAMISTSLIGWYLALPWQYYVIMLVASIFSTLIEAVSGVLRIDDNISIPLSIALVIFLFDYFVCPHWGFCLAGVL